MLDTIETLFGAFEDQAILRAELRRLFPWLKERGVTAIITGERGDGSLTRHGIEEYVSDCVIVLDHRVSEQTSTRRLRVLKYRGSLHGTNEYPFLIGRHGVSVLPITSIGLQHDGVDRARLQRGREPRRDARGRGPLPRQLGADQRHGGDRQVHASRRSSAPRPVAAASARSTSPSRSPRRRSCATWRRWASTSRAGWTTGLLQFRCVRPSLLGLEAHLASMQDLVNEFAPDVVVMDPISDLLHSGGGEAVFEMLTRQVDFLKSRGLTAVFTQPQHRPGRGEHRAADRLAHRHLADREARRGRRGPSAGHLRAQVARHGPLARDP